MSTTWSFDNIKHSPYFGEVYVKKFCILIKEYAANGINFEMKKILPVTEEELKLRQDSTVCYICRKNSRKSFLKIKIIEKLEITFILHSIFKSIFNLPKEIYVFFYSSSNYDCLFITKELANEIKGLRQIIEKFKSFLSQ